MVTKIVAAWKMSLSSKSADLTCCCSGPCSLGYKCEWECNRAPPARVFLIDTMEPKARSEKTKRWNKFYLLFHQTQKDFNNIQYHWILSTNQQALHFCRADFLLELTGMLSWKIHHLGHCRKKNQTKILLYPSWLFFFHNKRFCWINFIICFIQMIIQYVLLK